MLFAHEKIQFLSSSADKISHWGFEKRLRSQNSSGFKFIESIIYPSQAAIKSLNSPTVRSKTVRDCLTALAEVSDYYFYVQRSCMVKVLGLPPKKKTKSS